MHALEVAVERIDDRRPVRSATRAAIGRMVGDEARMALGWGVLFATTILGSAGGYLAAYNTPAERAALQAGLGTNTGLAALFGRPHTLLTLGGFTQWRSGGVLVIAGGIWGALLGARMFRGAEEDGRWEYLLTARADLSRITRLTVRAASAVLAIVWVCSAAAAVVSGRLGTTGFGAGAALLLATQLVGPAALLTAAGCLASQVFATRRQAAGMTAGVFAALFVLRMVAGVYPHQAWLRWVNPLVWFDSTDALGDGAPQWSVAGYGLAAACAATAIVLSRRRDLGAALLPERPPRHVARIVTATGLAARTTRSVAAGWVAMALVLAAIVGVLAGPVADASARSPGLQTVLSRVAGRSAGARAFLGLTMLTITTVLCLCAAALATALLADETSGRLDRLLAEPVGRVRWFAGRVSLAALVLAAGCVLVGLTEWVATRTVGTHIAISTMVLAGVNIAPTVLLVLAIGALAYAGAPRFTAVAGYGFVAASFVLELVGSLVRAPSWVLDLSLLHHLALAPAADPRWRTDAVLVALAVAAVGLGIRRLRGRDVLAA